MRAPRVQPASTAVVRNMPITKIGFFIISFVEGSGPAALYAIRTMVSATYNKP